jgi:hypothetical protein
MNTHAFRRKPKNVISPRVLILQFTPAAAIAQGWRDSLELANEYVLKMRELSHDQLIYRIIKTVTIENYPLLEDGVSYNDETWLKARQNDKLAERDAAGNYKMADYRSLANWFLKVEGQYDELWLFGGPLFGFYESRCVGKNAYWMNAPALELDCARFAIMGFNYERGVREMVHNFGHRVESTMQRWGHEQWPAFLQKHGDVHHAPGSTEEYSNDEFAWVSALKAEWWPYLVRLELVK